MRMPSRRSWSVVGLAIAAIVTLLWARRQAPPAEPFPPLDPALIRTITAARAAGPTLVDGRLDEPGWAAAERSARFVDLVSGGPTHLDTRVAILWDDEHLFVGYWVEEPNVTAEFTVPDDPVYLDNDVELFIAGADAYYEFEINALGTVYDGLFVWQSAYEPSGLARRAAFDRTNPAVRWQPFDGVGLKRHPRGPRVAFLDWDLAAVRSAVHVEGTLNDPSDTDRGWTVEVAVPWRDLDLLDLSRPRPLPPRPGDVWRIDCSRFNRRKDPANPADSGGWALSPHGVWDSHIPEVFPFVRFAGPAAARQERGE